MVAIDLPPHNHTEPSSRTAPDQGQIPWIRSPRLKPLRSKTPHLNRPGRFDRLVVFEAKLGTRVFAPGYTSPSRVSTRL